MDWICVKKTQFLFPVKNKADEQMKDVPCCKATARKWIITHYFLNSMPK